MFVEGNVEVNAKDRVVVGMDDHDLKLWLQRQFRGLSCYRISSFTSEGKVLRANVAIKTTVLPDNERTMLESNPSDTGALRSFIERMFDGKGSCRCLGDPKLRSQ